MWQCISDYRPYVDSWKSTVNAEYWITAENSLTGWNWVVKVKIGATLMQS